MQTSTDPYASKTESLATTLAGELERLRYTIRQFFGTTQWYIHTENVDFTARGTNVDGSGQGRHVTAIGYHMWGGSARFPAITSVLAHTTGIFWPAAHHMAISIQPSWATGVQYTTPTADVGGVEMIRYHQLGSIYHHTAALMFFHSEGRMHNGQRGHITAVSISRGLASMAGNEASGRDSLVFGHAGAVMQMVGAGASHIALGRHSYVALESHILTATFPSPRRNALYASLIPKAWVAFNGSSATATDMLDGFNVAGVTRTGTGAYTVRFLTPMVSQNFAVVCSGTSMTLTDENSVSDFTVTTFSVVGVGQDAARTFCIVFGSQ